MENKKALVIIPPYSEPLKKLGEILSTPEEAAHIEIYVLEDLKEAGQLIPTLGQCLIVIANAKKCALFLQENRWAISKNHSKVILMTPKEIPQKTLMKFLKIGLTEVILETLPPKSLLYKIKLLLRSVKGQENKKDENINVKSMLDMTQNKAGDEQQRVDKSIFTEDTSKEESETVEKKTMVEEESESFDYLRAKKKTAQEDNVIDTHWKSKRNETQLELEKENEDGIKTKEVEEISTYYKNDRANNLDLDFVNDEKMRGKGGAADDESEFSIEKLKQSALEELDLEDSQKPKKKNQFTDETDEDLYKMPEKEVSIELEKEKNESKWQEEEKISKKNNDKQTETNLEVEKEDKKTNDNDLNHIDAYYKGKITKQENLLESENEEDLLDNKLEEDFSKNDHNKTKQNNIDIDEDNDYLEKTNQDLNKKETDNNKKKSELDIIDTDSHMRGKISKTNQIELEDEITQQKEIIEKNESHLKTKKASTQLEEEIDDFYDKEEKIDADVKNKKAAEDAAIELDDSSDSFQQKMAKKLDLEFEIEDDSLDSTENNNEKDLKNNQIQRLAIEDQDTTAAEKEKREKEEERDPRLKKLNNTQFELEKADRDADGSGNVEHLDKYMRSKSSKSTDQNWDLGSKKKDTTIALEKGKNKDLDLNLTGQFKDAGEQTIDYRKLKEEFELLKEGANLPPDELERMRKIIRGEIEEDDSSHRVYVPEPKGVDFLMDIAINLYDSSVKPRDLFEKIAKKILAQKGHAVFLQYSKPSDIKEAFSIFQLTEAGLISDELRNRFAEMKKESDFFKNQTGYSLANWRCAEILDKNNKPWEDIELPSWAVNELHNKAVEYIYPMFDGLDRMGHIYIWFPEGINYSEAKFIDMVLEASRPLYLDQIIRASKNNKNNDSEQSEETTPEKKGGLFSGITSLFGKKKTG